MLNPGGVNPADTAAATLSTGRMAKAAAAPITMSLANAKSTNTINGRAYSAPKYSIIKIVQSEDGTYNLSLTEDTQPITMLQLAIACATTEEGFTLTVPDGWTEIGHKVEEGKVIFALGNTNPEGEVIKKDIVIASIKSTTKPEVIYTGPVATTMELATENSVVTYDFEARSSAGTPVSPSAGSSGGSGGCIAGFAGLALFALAPLAWKKLRNR